MKLNKNLISIVGTTAIGKSALAIELAKYFESEILSSDSRQFFKEMNIGTAVPSEQELKEVPHHFIQHISIHQKYSVGDYEAVALEKLNELFQQFPVLFLVGGSGLYEKAVINGLDYFPDIPKEIRDNLNLEFKTNGLIELTKELKKVDYEYYNNVDLKNPHRIIRALEVFRHTGIPFSAYRKNKNSNRDFNVIRIGLQLPREEIYARINHRVDLMMENGLLKEVQSLKEFRHLNALNTVGYKELFSYLNKEISLDFAIEEIKKNTRRFAKRQLTWYRKESDIQWFHPNDIQNIIEYINSEIIPNEF